MPSKAWTAFQANTKDIERLLELHRQEGGEQPGRRFGLEVLNKSGIVLITAFWEAYCEDVAEEGLIHLITEAPDSKALPMELKKLIAKDLKADPHDLRVWDLAGDGWRDILKKRADELREARNRKLNTPKTDNIDTLFKTAVGIEEVSKSWHWPNKMTVARARAKLDKFVTLRGAIAHRGAADVSVTKAQLVDFFEFIRKVGSRTGGAVNKHVKGITGKPLW
ncbi:MAG: hypothetical protein J0H49_09385 [Acidobacteria bacterium]|nr:hypothetical protein [Acidobacteriota bacterium]